MKKLKNMFSGRLFFALLTTLIQLVIWMGFGWGLEVLLAALGYPNTKIALWVYFSSEVVGVILCLYILMKNDHPSYKIVWVVFIVIMPTVGIFAYIFFGRHKIRNRLKKQFLSSQIDLRHVIENTRYVEDIKLSGSREPSNTCKLLAKNNFPAFPDTHTKYYGNIADMWPQILADLATAQKFIYLETFIISEGVFWDSIKKILTEKSLSGIDVRIIYDDFGTELDRKKLIELSDVGVKLFCFNRIGATFDASKNNRTHRKMIIVDGDVAFTGGFNIADEYVGKLERYGEWVDTAMRFEGPAVYSFTLMFLSFWQLQRNAKPLDKNFGYAPSPVASHTEVSGFVQPVSSGPLGNYRLIEYAFMQMISGAKKYIYITTPYLILDNEIEVCLCLAAKSGIDVRIIMPGIPDKKTVFGVSRSFYPNLLEAGVKIYEFPGGFVHAKQLVVDGRCAFIGTCNMDYRSFFLHFECGAVLYDTETIVDIEHAHLALQDRCRQVDLAWAQELKWYQRLWRSFARLFSPLL